MKSRFPVTPIVICATVYNKQCFDQVQYCVSKKTFQVFQCAPEFLKSNPSDCPTTVYLPTVLYESENELLEDIMM